jgi:hypothetical protein
MYGSISGSGTRSGAACLTRTSYSAVFSVVTPKATRVIDRFHVMRHAILAVDQVRRRVRSVIARRRWQDLDAEIAELDRQLALIIEETAPKLISVFGVGPDVAGALLTATGDNPERFRSEASFAALCGVSPLDASSGRQRRHRLNRGGGADRDGMALKPSGCQELSSAIVGISGFPGHHPGWAQFRTLGAASLEFCAVAEGVLDAYMLVGRSTLYGWDYLAGLLICHEAGAVVVERDGAELVVRDDAPRRPIVAATPQLAARLLKEESL